MPWEWKWGWVEREIALFKLRLTVPEDFLALNRKNAALLLWDLPDSYPVWQLGMFVEPKKAAHSTYWEVKLLYYGHPLNGCSAFPATGALKLYRKKIHFMLIKIIKIGI